MSIKVENSSYTYDDTSFALEDVLVVNKLQDSERTKINPKDITDGNIFLGDLYLTNPDIAKLQTQTQNEGVLDLYLRTVGKYILNEYKEERINKSDYSKVLLGVIPVCVQEANKFVLQKAVTEKTADLTEAKIKFTIRQTGAFEDKKQLDILDVQMKAFIGIFSDAGVTEVPGLVRYLNIDKQVERASKKTTDL